MIDLAYSLVIEATDDPCFFSFYSEELQGFSGVGHSVEDCLYKARWGMAEHVKLLMEEKMPVPPMNPNPPGPHTERGIARGLNSSSRNRLLH